MLARASAGGAIVAAVVYPCDTAVLDAAKAVLIVAILIGPVSLIHAVAKDAGVDISGLKPVGGVHIIPRTAEILSSFVTYACPCWNGWPAIDALGRPHDAQNIARRMPATMPDAKATYSRVTEIESPSSI